MHIQAAPVTGEGVVLATTDVFLSGPQSHSIRWSHKLLILFEISSQEATCLSGCGFPSPSIRIFGAISITLGSIVPVV